MNRAIKTLSLMYNEMNGERKDEIKNFKLNRCFNQNVQCALITESDTTTNTHQVTVPKLKMLLVDLQAKLREPHRN